MASTWLLFQGTLVENSTTHVAVIDAPTLAAASGLTSARPDPRLFNYHIQITALGAATSVTVEGMSAGGVWTQIATGKTAAATANSIEITTGVWDMIRLTWTGGTPDGAGRASFYATRKFNGVQ